MEVSGPFDWVEGAAQERAEARLTRRVLPRTPDDGLLDLAGNDYLGMVTGLAGAGTHLACDRHNHASRIGATRLAKASDASAALFGHADLTDADVARVVDVLAGTRPVPVGTR